MGCGYEVDRIGMKTKPMIELIIDDEERLRFEMQLIGNCRRIMKEQPKYRWQSEAGWNGSGTISLRIGKFKFRKLLRIKDDKTLSEFFGKSNEMSFGDPYEKILMWLVNRYSQFSGGTPIIYLLNGIQISFRMVGYNANGGQWSYSGLRSSDYYSALKLNDDEKLMDFRVSVESLMDSMKYYEKNSDPKEIADRLYNYKVKRLTERVEYLKSIGHLNTMQKAQDELTELTQKDCPEILRIMYNQS